MNDCGHRHPLGNHPCEEFLDHDGLHRTTLCVTKGYTKYLTVIEWTEEWA